MRSLRQLEPQVLQPRDLGLGEALVGDVGERRPAPQRERLAQRRRRLPRLAARELLAPAPEALLEAVGVERARRRAHGVAAALQDARAVAERGAQPRRHDLHRVARVCGPGALPQLVHDAVEADDRAAVHEQQRQQRERASARYAGGPAGFESTSIGPRIRNRPALRAEPIRGRAQVKAIRKRAARASAHAHDHARRARSPPRPPTCPWGMLAAIDLHGCDRERLEDPDTHPALRARR